MDGRLLAQVSNLKYLSFVLDKSGIAGVEFCINVARGERGVVAE